MSAAPRARGPRVFLIIWFGQTVSAIGTGLGSFALGVWVFETTRSATQFALIAFFAAVPALLLAPLAGAASDRLDRRLILIFTDVASALMTMGMAFALASGHVRIWYVYPFVMAMVTLGVFQSLAFVSSVSVLVRREQLTRASGMTQASQAIAQILGPVLAGLLIGFISYHGVLLADSCTFLFGALTLALVRIPRLRAGERNAVEVDAEGPAAAPAGGAAYGWHYIRARPGLFILMLMFALTNFSMAMVQVLLAPLVLSFAPPRALGTVNSVAAIGSLAGAGVLGLWGGPRSRVGAILICLMAQALLLVVGGVLPSVTLIACAATLFMFTVPIMNGCNEAIWQTKVAHDAQGRVFAARQMIVLASVPLAYLISGPLADRLLNPLLVPGGALAGSIGRLTGVGPGRGVGLLLMILGGFILAVVFLFSLNPRLRRVEQELLDARPVPAEAEASMLVTKIEPQGAL
jgi:MFS transporter, DHA3 family, macrolide efflux protein